MTKKSGDLDAVKRLVRRHGAAPAPTVETLITEVRSDGFMNVPPPTAAVPSHVLGATLIEWSYTLSWADVGEFHEFLRDNEKFIADSCGKLMTGVEYRGTYVVLGGERPTYKTIWAYATGAAVAEWENALKSKSGNFYKAMQQFRSYSIREPGHAARWYAPAALYTDIGQPGRGTAFIALTIAAAKGQTPPGAARRSRRKGK